MIAAALRGLCGLVGGDRSRYYQKPTAEEVAQRDAELWDEVERVALEFPGYGYRRVTEQLGRQGLVVNHRRVLRVMREESPLCQLKRRYVVTTDPKHPHRTDPNLLSGLLLGGLDLAWAADIIYIRLPASFAYLAAIPDAYSRRCVGWAISRFTGTKLTPAASEAALRGRRAPRGFVHHSDRGAVRVRRARRAAGGVREPASVCRARPTRTTGGTLHRHTLDG